MQTYLQAVCCLCCLFCELAWDPLTCEHPGGAPAASWGSRVTLGCTGLLLVGAPPERRTCATSMDSAWTEKGRQSQCNTRWSSLAPQAHPYISPAPLRSSKFKRLCDGEVPELHRGVKGVSGLPHHFSSISSGGTLTKWLCCQ